MDAAKMAVVRDGPGGISTEELEEAREHFVADGRDLIFGGDLSMLPGMIVAREALRRGVFLRHDGPETIQVTPPLVATEAECDVALDALDAGLSILDSLCA